MYNNEFLVWLALKNEISSKEIEQFFIDQITSASSYQNLLETEKDIVLYRVAFKTLAHDHSTLLTRIFKLKTAIENHDLTEAAKLIKNII